MEKYSWLSAHKKNDNKNGLSKACEKNKTKTEPNFKSQHFLYFSRTAYNYLNTFKIKKN